MRAAEIKPALKLCACAAVKLMSIVKAEELQCRRRPDRQLRAALGKLIERRARLFEKREEDDGGGNEDQDKEQPSASAPLHLNTMNQAM